MVEHFAGIEEILVSPKIGAIKISSSANSRLSGLQPDNGGAEPPGETKNRSDSK